MTDDLTFRRATPDDAERLRELNEVALRGVDAYAEDVVGEEAEEAEEDLDADLDDVEATYVEAGGEFLVGEADDEVVAMGALKPVGEGEKPWAAEMALQAGDGAAAEVTRMRVDPEYQRRGIGTRLMERLEARARELGFEVLVLDTTARQEGAQRLYEGFDFERVEDFEWREYEVLLYRKELA